MYFIVCLFVLASAAEPERGVANGYCSDHPSLSISYVNYLKVSEISVHVLVLTSLC